MARKFLCRIFVVFSIFIFSCGFVFADEDKSVITIEQAQKSEYKKDPVNGGDCIILTGNVKISVSRGGSKTTINANLINYNRSTEMIFAEGDVSLEQSGGSAGGQNITASSLLFNTSTLEGVFDNGRAVHASSDAINLPSGSKLVVASEVFGRDSGGTISFKTGELTFCDDENPHWRIKASRIWLLPGGEFAFLNAVLYVGHVPLLYLPAFYYPKDELLFNPAFGYRAREGYYINTTTYLYGRKGSEAKSTADLKSSSSSSDDDDKINFFSFMNTGAMKEQRREGLVLHNLDEDFKGDTSRYFKIMADYYANLGVMVGFDGSFAPGSYLTKLDVNGEFAFSNTVFRSNGVYLPKNSLGEVVQDKSNFLGFEKDFRYQANLKMVFARPFSLTLSLPVYSDPYFDFDFNTRAETMDWIDFAMSGSDLDNNETDVTETSSFTWNLNGNYNFKIPQLLNPFVSSFSVSSFSSSVVFSSKAADTEKLKLRKESADSSWISNTPERKFYYPSQISPFKISTRISGTLVQIPSTRTTAANSNSVSLNLELPEDLNTEEKEKKDDKAAAGDEKSEKIADAEGDEESEKTVLGEDALPELNVPSFSTTKLNGISYNLGYSISPDFTSQISYDSASLDMPEDFNWNDMQSTFVQFRSPATITSRLGYRDSFISLTDTFSINPVYQKHPFLKEALEDSTGKKNDTSNGGYSEDSISSIKKTDYAAKKFDITDTNSLSFRPFYLTKHFSDTSLNWNTTIKMLETKFTGDAESPEWEYLTMDLTDEDCFTTHNLNLVLSAKEFDNKVSQTLSLTTTLPPQVDAYRGVLTLGFPYVSFTCGTGIKKTSQIDSTWIKEDFNQSLSLNMFNNKLHFSQNYVYNMENEEKSSLRFSLSGYGFQLSKTWSNVIGYKFDDENHTGWKSLSSDDKKFQPYQLSLAYSSPSKNFTALGDKISLAPTLSTSVVYDNLRPTNSYFRFIPALTFKLNNFLNVTFSAETRNGIIFRYFCSDDEYEKYYSSTGERNFVKDLMDSFRFDDESKRKSSAFKIQSLKIDVTHDLDDWDLNCSFSIKPRLLSAGSKGFDASKEKASYYDFSPYFSISVSWRPLASMKTEIVDEYGEWELNP